MKNKFLKILTITSIFIVLSLVVTKIVWKNQSNIVASESSLSFNYQGEQRSPFTNSAYDYSTKYRRVTLGENVAFCVDYGREITSNGTNLAYKGDMSPEALAVLVYGYPNKDLGEFGMSGEEATEVQYLVTQMAFWNVVTKTGENKGYKFNFNDLVANSGYESIMSEMKSAAEKLADSAIQYPYTPNPAIKIDSSNYKLEEKGDLYLAGPYKITGYDGGTKTDFTVKSVDVSLINAPSTAQITDANGAAKSNFSIGDSVYVIARKSDTSANFSLVVNASGDKLNCGMYGLNSNSGLQDFATITKEPVTVSESVPITWSNDTGNITIIKEDQEGRKIKDIRFEIKDSNGQKIAEAVTNADGRVDLLNMPTGIYSIKEISAPTGYIIDTTVRSAIVTAGATSNVQFTNAKVSGKLQIAKKDENGDPIANVKFKIMDSNKKQIETITTNSKGIATSSALNIGKYYFSETSAPDHVIMDTTEYSFDITGYDQVVTRELENDIVKGSLKITKKDENGELLSGVKFDILDSNKKKIQTITTNNSGVAVSKDLEPGTYYYKETSTKDKNLIVDSTEKEFVITDSSQIIAKQETNNYKKGSLKIIKVDQSQNPIAGVTFEIYNSKQEKIDTMVTNNKGIANSNVKMVLGSYYYKEVSAPANIEVDPQMKPFKITEDNQVVEFTIKNNIIEGKLKILKVDESNNTIQGAEFEILDSNKNVIQTLTTDEIGVAISNKLNKGTYYYRETKTPNQYVLDSSEHEFTIKTDNDFVEEKVVNKFKTAKLIIHKINKDDGSAMKDIRFEILDENKKAIASIVTDENGKAESETLKNGKYYYKEVSVPDNIVLDSNEYEFNIQDGDVEKTVYNVQKKLPVTGSLFSTNVIIVIVVTLSCILIYVIVKMIIAYIQNRNNNW